MSFSKEKLDRAEQAMKDMLTKDVMDKWLIPPIVAENEQLKARVVELEKKWAHAVDAYRAADERKTELEAMTVRLCDIAKVYMTQEAWLRFDADVQRSVFGR